MPRRSSKSRDTPVTEARSRNMGAIRSRDSKAELTVRRGLHASGLRYRLGWNRRRMGRLLPGKPDLVFPRHRAVLFIHGCFWHGHNCHLFKWPKTEAEFWREKIERNAARDREVCDVLLADGWRVGEVWECALRGRNRRPVQEVIDACSRFIRGSDRRLMFGGKDVGPTDKCPAEATMTKA